MCQTSEKSLHAYPAKRPKRDSWQRRAANKHYYSRPDWVGGKVQYFQLIDAHVKQGSRILEIGAGPANDKTEYLAAIGEVTGIDIDPCVRGNHYCHKAAVYDGINIPCEPDTFDAVVAYYVLEHVQHPVELTYEIHRVLRDGGVFIFRTPNLYHYVSLVAKLTPMWFHRLVANRARTLRRGDHGLHPTFHRMNTRRVCRRILARCGFRVTDIRCIEGPPAYGMFSVLAFYPMMFWERVLNASSLFEDLRGNILCVAIADKSAGKGNSEHIGRQY